MNKYQHMISQLKRNVDVKTTNRKYLLSFEDAKSSPTYFKSFLRSEKINFNSFVFRNSVEGSDPMSVIDAAIKAEDEMKLNEGFSRGNDDEVWIVIDVDQHAGLSNAIDRCLKKGYKMAISNPCFEYWVLLHFEDSASGVLNCNDLISKHLKNHLPNYSKGNETFENVVPHVRKAIKHARGQHKSKLEECPSGSCPSTTLYKLFDSILKKFDES